MKIGNVTTCPVEDGASLVALKLCRDSCECQRYSFSGLHLFRK